MKGGSESMAMTGVLQSSTPMLKFISESVRLIQLPGEAQDSDTAWTTSQAAKAHCFSTLTLSEKTQGSWFWQG